MRISDWSSDVCSSDLTLDRIVVRWNRGAAPPDDVNLIYFKRVAQSHRVGGSPLAIPSDPDLLQSRTSGPCRRRHASCEATRLTRQFPIATGRLITDLTCAMGSRKEAPGQRGPPAGIRQSRRAYIISSS